MKNIQKRATFRTMRDGTAEDYEAIISADTHNEKDIARRVLEELKRTAEGEQGFNISRFDHSLQSATLAYRDGADEEMVVAALLHDIGDNLALHNHADLAAAILKPYVSGKTHWIIQHHAIFQGYYFWHFLGDDRNAREQFRDHPWFDDCTEFCEKYDQNAFDDEYDNLPFEFFEPMVERIFSRQPFGEHVAYCNEK